MSAEERRSRAELPEELRELNAEVAGLPDRIERRFDPGPRAVVVAVGVLALIGSVLLPWIGGSAGWEVFAGIAEYGPLPRLFTYTLIAFGVLGSVLALLTRRWVIAFVCAVGCGISTVNGIWAIWSRQIGADSGLTPPQAGLVLGTIGVLVLTFTWAGVALRRG